MMTLDLIVNDWKEAIYAAGRMLEKVGHCSNKYTERMVELVRKKRTVYCFCTRCCNRSRVTAGRGGKFGN